MVILKATILIIIIVVAIVITIAMIMKVAIVFFELSAVVEAIVNIANCVKPF